VRERWSKVLAAVTGALVLLLAYAVADLRNAAEQAGGEPPAEQKADDASTTEDAAPYSAQAATGMEIYDREGCALCHSIGGEGNPRNPLDGVGDRRSAEEVRKWIVAAPELEDALDGGTFDLKQAYGELPEDELAALVAYLRNPEAASRE